MVFKVFFLCNVMVILVIDDDGNFIGMVDEIDFFRDSEVVRVMKSIELVVFSEEDWIFESYLILFFEKVEF